MMMDPTFIILIPAMLLSMYAQFKVSSTFAKYSQTRNRRGVTGAAVAQELLSANGIHDVSVEHVKGNLTDHYDPRTRTVRLSDSVYNSTSLAALGVAAHEVGHAMQHNVGYVPLALRSSIVPAANIGTRLAWPLILIGMFLSIYDLIWVGVILFSFSVVFYVVTLPVEFNASSRATEMLVYNRILEPDEVGPAKKVLSAAALTYVAAAIVAVMQLLRFVLMFSRRR